MWHACGMRRGKCNQAMNALCEHASAAMGAMCENTQSASWLRSTKTCSKPAKPSPSALFHAIRLTAKMACWY